MQNANVAQAIVDFGNTDKFLKLEGGCWVEQPKLQAHALPIELLSRICCMSYSLPVRHLYSLLMKQMLDVGTQNDLAFCLTRQKKEAS